MIELNGDVKPTPKLILPKSYTNNNLELITKYHPLLAIDFDEDFKDDQSCKHKVRKVLTEMQFFQISSYGVLACSVGLMLAFRDVFGAIETDLSLSYPFIPVMAIVIFLMGAYLFMMYLTAKEELLNCTSTEELNDEQYKAVQEVINCNPVIKRYVSERIKKTGRLTQRDCSYLRIWFQQIKIREIDSKADKKVLASRYKQNILKSLGN